MVKTAVILILTAALVLGGCGESSTSTTDVTESKQPPTELPEGILVDRVPENADIIFASIRYVLDSIECLDDNYEIKQNFITDAGCNQLVYNAAGTGLAAPQQLFAMDIETGKVEQLTNMDFFFTSGQVVNPTTIMASAACADTNGDGTIGDSDEKELYYLDLFSGNVDCITGPHDFEDINNPDYSPVAKKTVFSGAMEGWGSNKLFTVDADKNLVQLTDDEGYSDFDCAWSEDATKVVFSRLPKQDFPWTIPSQVWMIDSDGTNAVKITDGGPNPDNEESLGHFPIGIDTDPDLSPDNGRIVFSRLKTGQKNVPFGIWELVVIDVETGQEEIVDSSYANMLPEWKSRGILCIRQTGSDTAADKGQLNPMNIKQSLYIYIDGVFTELEHYPYNIFPIGSFGASWIE